jgi:hypothetical protein
MPEYLAKAIEFVNELRKQHSKYTSEVPGKLSKVYGLNREKGRPDTFKDSSFLYIRSYDGDVGVRPFSGVTFWLSPDINISPISQLGDFTTELEAGKSYNIGTRLHNRGDLIVPFPKVEFFLTDPTLGFNTTVASYLGVTQLPAMLLPASNDEANFLYQVPSTEAGHKCLFARTYSFSPLDKPFDLNMLDPRLDRHIAQKNLNFVPQNTPYAFNVVHQPKASETIAFAPVSRDQVFAIQHPTLRNLKVSNLRNAELLQKIKIELTGDTGANLSRSRGSWTLKAAGRKGPSLDQQSNLLKRTEAIVREVNNGKTTFASHKRELEAFREMNKAVVKTSLRITIPDFGLAKGAAAAFNIINTNNLNGEIKGGITVVVIGR